MGERGDPKLIVSVSFGTRAVFTWKGKSCPESEDSSCWLDHGDLLVMGGQCQDEFLHCTDPGPEQERVNIACRWIKQHDASCSLLRTGVACCLPTCAQCFTCFCYGVCGVWRCLGIFWGSWGSCSSWGCQVASLRAGDLSHAGVPFAGHALWAEVGGGILFVVLWEFIRKPEKCANACGRDWGSKGYCCIMLYMLVLVRLPSLHDYDACMVFWFTLGKLQAETMFFSALS